SPRARALWRSWPWREPARLFRRGRGFMKKIGFVGAGNMAGALIRGLLRAGHHDAEDIWASDPVDVQLRRLKRMHKIEVTRDNRQLVRGSQSIILAVKPQNMAAVLDEIRTEVTPRKLFISIAAGFPLRRLEAGLGGQARVVRVMPNTPALGGRGISVVVSPGGTTQAGLTSLDSLHFRDAVIAAVEAATRRARELAAA